MKQPLNNRNKIIVNNIEELLIKEYYIKYLPKNNELVKNPNTIYDKEILNNYTNIYSRLDKIRQIKSKY